MITWDSTVLSSGEKVRNNIPNREQKLTASGLKEKKERQVGWVSFTNLKVNYNANSITSEMIDFLKEQNYIDETWKKLINGLALGVDLK